MSRFYAEKEVDEKKGAHPQFEANFDGRFFSREAAKKAKENALYGFSALSPEEDSSAMEFRPLRVLRVLRGFA